MDMSNRRLYGALPLDYGLQTLGNAPPLARAQESRAWHLDTSVATNNNRRLNPCSV